MFLDGSIMRGASGFFVLVLALLAGMLMAPSRVPAESDMREGDMSGVTHEGSMDAEAQVAHDEPSQAGSPVKVVAQPPVEERPCANVVLLDSGKFCRYAAAPTATEPLRRAR
jgi:hypothetical protein